MAKYKPKHVAENTANKGREDEYRAQRSCFASTVSLYAKNANNSEVIHFSITLSNMKVKTKN
jgi:hypothetical protein